MPGARAMVVSLGGTTEPVVRSIAHHRPEFVSILASQDSVALLSEVRRALTEEGVEVRSEISLVDDVNDLLHCYRKAVEAVDRAVSKGFDSAGIVVDYTGGTKNMSVALALAALGRSLTFSYVGGAKRTKGGVGVVESGTERVVTQVNPWDLLALEERGTITTLFNRCQYAAALDVLRELTGRTSLLKATFSGLAFLVEGYRHWDLFRHEEALKAFGRARLEEMSEHPDRAVAVFARETATIQPLLQGLSSCGKRPCRPFVLDLFANAERRFSEGKTDDAVLRLYRLIEMIVQERLLSDHGIDASDVDPGKVPEELAARIKGAHRSVVDGKIKIPQGTAFELLAALGDPLGLAWRSRKDPFLKLQTARNNSWLAHGFVVLDDNKYAKLKDFVLGLGALDPREAPAFPTMRL